MSIRPLPPPTIRSLVVPVYLPSFLMATGEGAVVPVIALTARHFGASAAVAGLVVALAGVGVLLGDLPSGWLVARFGEGAAIVVGTAVLCVALVACVLASSVAVFALAILLLGCGWSVWVLARLHYVGDVVPYALRGRALSTLGGIWRVGFFVGPFIGAGLIALGGLKSVYVLHLLLGIVACAVIVRALQLTGEHVAAREFVSLRHTLSEHRRTFLTAGVAASLISAVRTIRQALVPLWAVHIGLGAEAASIIYGISLGFEVAVFYPAGFLLDRLGRRPIAAGSMFCIAAGLFVMPLSHAVWVLLVSGVVIGLGNGLGSGIVMTLGIDFAPPQNRAQFLGVWRVCGDIGSAAGPLAIAGIIALFTLGASVVAAGALAVIAAATVLAIVPETLRRVAPVEHALLSSDS